MNLDELRSPRRPVRTIRALGVLALCAVAISCAVPNDGERSGSSADYLSAEDIAGVDAGDMQAVVQRLRPRWLTGRGARSFGTPTDIVVYQDNSLLGGLEALRSVSPGGVRSARYLDSATASATLPGLGTRHVAGAIILRTRDD